jgi:hypothetical protein
MSFSVGITNLSEVQKSLEGGVLTKKVLAAFGQEVRQLHSAIESAVFERYNTTKRLSSILEGNSVSNVKFGAYAIENDLTYHDKPLPLGQFITSQERVDVKSPASFFGQKPGIPSTFEKQIPKTWAVQTNVSVVRGRTVPVTGGYTIKPKVGRGSSGTMLSSKMLMKRSGAETWDQYPEVGFAGERAEVTPLWAPSLASMAYYVVTHDSPKVTRQLDRFAENIAKVLGEV